MVQYFFQGGRLYVNPNCVPGFFSFFILFYLTCSLVTLMALKLCALPLILVEITADKHFIVFHQKIGLIKE